MKRPKPMAPRDADQLNKAILAVNALDDTRDEFDCAAEALWNTMWVCDLPALSKQALAEFVNGEERAPGNALQNMPNCEWGDFVKRAGHVRRMGKRIQSLERLAASLDNKPKRGAV
jgi:hypothetical protein